MFYCAWPSARLTEMIIMVPSFRVLASRFWQRAMLSKRMALPREVISQWWLQLFFGKNFWGLGRWRHLSSQPFSTANPITKALKKLRSIHAKWENRFTTAASLLAYSQIQANPHKNPI